MKDTPGKPAPVTGATLDEKIKNARAQLDAQVRDIVRWHFSPDTGTPFWLEKAKAFKFNPLKDVNGWDDSRCSRSSRTTGCAAGRSTAGFRRACKDKPWYVFETGGTTGIPKSRVVADDFRIDYEMFSRHAAGEVLPQGQQLAHARPVAARGGCGWRSSTSASIAAASASASTSTRAGWSSSSRRAGWST